MADAGWLYLLCADDMLRHRVTQATRRDQVPWSGEELTFVDPVPAPPGSEAGGQPLLEWIAQELARPEPGEREGEELVGEYLFEYTPGMFWAADFRHAWGMDDDLVVLTRDLPQLRARLGLVEYAERLEGRGPGDESVTQRAAEVPEQWDRAVEEWKEKERRLRERFFAEVDTPLRVLNLQGWKFLTRDDMEALSQALAATSTEALGYAEEWEEAFAAHRSRPYDVAAVISTGAAWM